MLLKIPKLPVWEGTYPDPDKGSYGEFNLLFNKELNIFQKNISKTFYENNDYKYITKPPGSGDYSNKRGNRMVEIILRYIKKRNFQKILEIGAASDYILKALEKEITFEEATLVDPSLNEITHDKIKTLKEYYPSSKINHEKFDLIYCINVLEHVDNPRDFLNNVNHNLNENGLIIFIFPDVEYRLKIGDVGCLLHEHINYFTNQSAALLFENCGFEIIDCSSKNDNGELHICCKKNGDIQQIDQKSNINNNQILELSNNISLIPYKLKKTREKFLNFYSKGMKVGFHGACNSLSNFLFLSDLNCLDDYYIFDGDKLKSDTYLPFSSKKIMHYSNKIYREMDILFISATNFSNEIALDASKFIDKKRIIDLYK